MHNEHVYKYWRWLRWNALNAGRTIAVDFYSQWAEDEKTAQQCAN